MAKIQKLLSALASASKNAGGIHTARELAYIIGEQYTPAFKKMLSDCVNEGVIRRVARGVFESTLTPAEPSTAIYKIVNKLRDGVLNYISLESQLSHTGDISQVLIDRLTVMTKGRSGTFETPYGVIEFTHTKKPLSTVVPNLYLDEKVKMFRASTELAVADLKACNRNLHMLEG